MEHVKYCYNIELSPSCCNNYDISMQHLIEEIISCKPVWLASVCTYVFVFVLSTIVLNKHIPHIRKHTPTRAIHMRAHTHKHKYWFHKRENTKMKLVSCCHCSPPCTWCIAEQSAFQSNRCSRSCHLVEQSCCLWSVHDIQHNWSISHATSCLRIRISSCLQTRPFECI